MNSEALFLSTPQLLDIFNLTPTATAIHIGEDAKIQVANDAMLGIWGKTREAVIGKSLADALPELKDQPFIEMFKKVWHEGLVISGNDTAADLLIGGMLKTFYFDFEYRAVKNPEGKTICILHTAIDVTERVLNQEKLRTASEKEQALEREQLLNEELAATIDELEATNERLKITNEELDYAKENLTMLNNELEERVEERVKELSDSEERLLQAIDTGKMGTWSINPETLKVTMSDFVRDMLGLPEDREPEMTQILASIHPEYHEVLLSVLEKAIKNHEPSDNEYPVTNLKTGVVKWVKATGRIFTNRNGEATEYSGLFMDITDRKLEELRKNDFIGMVSHELKTPLTALNGFVQVLQHKADKSEDNFATSALGKAYSQIKKMTGMINGFLNVSRLESGKLHIEKKKFDLAKLFNEVVEDVNVLHSSHVINLNIDKAVQVHADRDKIGNVLSNLINNAIKYSPGGGNVDVNCTSVNEQVVCRVKDYGIGISEEDKEKLFDRYYRVAGNPTIAGFGLGLYLCAEIIRGHNGNIWVDSILNKGSSFYFSLPLH
ncbi:ATP-binding protein [Pedobacter aquatilis]|uniref:PAS domain-containing sensor histidine kinase n=1 Tax=Pedobacter aquatilis TaxID=351343 RepID=UPI002930881E|nr:ATP-binding protein [Pedobacter aquatilis]